MTEFGSDKSNERKRKIVVEKKIDADDLVIFDDKDGSSGDIQRAVHFGRKGLEQWKVAPAPSFTSHFAVLQRTWTRQPFSFGAWKQNIAKGTMDPGIAEYFDQLSESTTLFTIQFHQHTISPTFAKTTTF